MKKSIVLFSFILLFVNQAFAQEKCFLIKENDKIIIQEGDCARRHAPESSFKIPLSLMAYDAGIFTDETHPVWVFKDGYDLFINVCKSAHDPRTWMRDSCVWFSQVLTKKLGIEKFKSYVEKFNYGNRNISGDKDKNNGLSNSWLSSSLEISPVEQIIFLQKLINNKLSVSQKAHDMTKHILFKEELSGGWMLYGKTGMGRQQNASKTEKLDLYHGWFVGWIEKNERIITFVSHVTDSEKHDVFASFRIRDELKNKLWKLIEDLEK